MQDILRDLFQQGSLSGLQVAGSPAEYYVRVGIQLGEKKCSSILSQVVVTLPSHHAPRPVIICAKEVQPSP